MKKTAPNGVNTQPHGHGDSMNELAQWGQFSENPILDTRISVLRSDFVTLTVPPPLDSERGGGLESSGRRLISSIGKTKIIALFRGEQYS